MPHPLVALYRGATKACPWCGRRRLFTRWFTLRERCPGCGHRFEREEGYWLGAMAISIGFTSALFIAGLVLGMVLLWPDVPWGALTIALMVMNAIVPLVFYPFSKTLWIAVDMLFHQGSADDRSSWLGG